MNEIVELEKLISTLEINNDKVNQLLEAIKKNYETEKFIKNSMNSFIIDKWLSDEYYNSFRYEYNKQHLNDFSKTNLFPDYLKVLIDNGNTARVKEILIEVEKLEEEY